jgi:hypothetical protein
MKQKKTLFYTTGIVMCIVSTILSFTSCQNDDYETEKPHQEINSEALLKQEELLRQALKGGLEKDSDGAKNEGKAATDTRVLINGSIIGHNVSGYQQPFISQGGNLIGHAAQILNRYEYTSTFSNGILTATRNNTNTFGAISIKLTNGSAIVNYTTASGTNTSITLPESVTIINGYLMCPARILTILAGCSIAEWDADTKTLQTYYYEVNDFGLYFYGTQQNAITTDVAGCQKYIPGEPNAFFDPNKPTLIYVHGWQKGSVSARGREGFLFTQDNQWQNVQNYWRNAGWNVAIFHWVQMADDDYGAMPVDTEKKIYDANSPVGMRWKKSDGNFSSRGNPTLNVTQLFRQEYQKIIGVSLSNIRVMGNSLGGNLTMSMLREVAINGSRLPERVTLMDPYWDLYLGDPEDQITLPAGMGSTKEVGRDSAIRLNGKNVAIEYFKTSAAGMSGYNKYVADIAAYVNFIPGYTDDVVAKHTQPPRQYMWALGFSAPTIGPSPNMTNANVRTMMNTQMYWNHVGGTLTATPSDDSYNFATGKP